MTVPKFKETRNTDYNTDYIKGGKNPLPYTSMSYIGRLNNRLMLHFVSDFGKPLMLIYDIHTKQVRNFIDIEAAKSILNDKIYDNLQFELSYSRTENGMSRILYGVENINQFMQEYSEENHRNADTITGYDCVEYDLDL